MSLSSRVRFSLSGHTCDFQPACRVARMFNRHVARLEGRWTGHTKGKWGSRPQRASEGPQPRGLEATDDTGRPRYGDPRIPPAWERDSRGKGRPRCPRGPRDTPARRGTPVCISFSNANLQRHREQRAPTTRSSGAKRPGPPRPPGLLGAPRGVQTVRGGLSGRGGVPDEGSPARPRPPLTLAAVEKTP